MRKWAKGKPYPAINRFFESNIPEPNSGCWLWFGSVNKKGYGAIRVDGVVTKAHRFSYSQFKGPIPDGYQVCHKCDTPSCVNPDHLFVGTNYDNMRDRDNKGRTAKGENAGNWKGGLCGDIREYHRNYLRKWREQRGGS